MLPPPEPRKLTAQEILELVDDNDGRGVLVSTETYQVEDGVAKLIDPRTLDGTLFDTGTKK